MSWEFDAGNAPADGRDRTKLVWGGILIGVAVMAGLMVLMSGESKSSQSRVYVKQIFIQCNRSDAADRDRALELANDVRRRLVAGEITFEDAARNYSAETASAAKGGHLGWLTKSEFAEGIAKEFAWNGPVGELSNVLESNFGFHLLFIEKRELSASDLHQRELREKVFNEETPAPQE